MFYKPKLTGALWDTWLYHHDGTFYLYYLSMGLVKDSRYDGQGVGMAISKNGVDWQEIGLVLDKESGAFGLGTGSVWKASDFEVSNRFIMNYSIWFEPVIEAQTIRFAYSYDLINWTKFGETSDFPPDPRFYERYPENAKARWDCIYTIERPGGGRYGYWTADPRGRMGFGFGETLDGVRFEALEAPMVSASRHGECGAIEQIDGRYYMLYDGGRETIVAPAPNGPFETAKKNPTLLHGNAYFARFFPLEGELLANFHAISRVGLFDSDGKIPRDGDYNFSSKTESTRFAPLMKAVVDPEGTLRLGYWQGNEQCKRQPVSAELQPASFEGLPHLRMFTQAFPASQGAIIEAQIDVVDQGYSAGFYLAYDDDQGSYFVCRPNGCMEIGRINLRNQENTFEWLVDHAVTLGASVNMRLMVENEFVAVFFDDLLMQVYSLPRAWTGAAGVFAAKPPERLDAWLANGV